MSDPRFVRDRNKNWAFGGSKNRERWVGEWVVYRRWACRWSWAEIGREVGCSPTVAKTIFDEVKTS